MEHPVTAQLVPLVDGRSLFVREYGDPNGRPVISHHGGLVSGADVETAASAARALGLRLVSPNRPGVGASSQAVGRTHASWAADALQVADYLGLDRFGVLGWSMGGPYAMAVAALHPERVTHAVVVAGAPPGLDGPTLGLINATDRRLTYLCEHYPRAGAAVFAAVRTFARRTPGAFEVTTRWSLGHLDGAAVRALGHGTLARWTAEGTAVPLGLVEEYRTWIRPWGFSLQDIKVPVQIWHGDQDKLIDATLEREMASAIPNATFHQIDQGGHFLALGRWAQILRPFAVASP
jgi:pimeloyl-ACP methyl ester carboxylesterase